MALQNSYFLLCISLFKSNHLSQVPDKKMQMFFNMATALDFLLMPTKSLDIRLCQKEQPNYFNLNSNVQ